MAKNDRPLNQGELFKKLAREVHPPGRKRRRKRLVSFEPDNKPQETRVWMPYRDD